jgi:hypothetical protein
VLGGRPLPVVIAWVQILQVITSDSAAPTGAVDSTCQHSRADRAAVT